MFCNLIGISYYRLIKLTKRDRQMDQIKVLLMCILLLIGTTLEDKLISNMRVILWLSFCITLSYNLYFLDKLLWKQNESLE